MIPFYSVRVSNELGAGNARIAKISVVVVTLTSLLIGIFFMVVVLAAKDYFPYLFTNSEAVAKETTKLAYLLAFTVVLNSVQPVLSGNYKFPMCLYLPINFVMNQVYKLRLKLLGLKSVVL